MKKLLIILLKLGVSLALITYLVIDVRHTDPQTFTRLQAQPKNWSLLAAAGGCALAALMLGVVRWHLLIRALGLPYRLAAAFRVGTMAFLIDYAALGAAGGDLAKAVLLARAQPGRRARAVASVVADRAIGFSALVLTTSVATLCISLPDPGPAVRTIIGVTRLLAFLAALGTVLVLAPRTLHAPLLRLLRGLPRIGGMVLHLIEAIRMYRTHLDVLALAGLIAALSLGLNVTAVYLIARALPAGGPAWHEHLLIVPLTLMSGIIPLPAGLGVSDYALSYLYAHVPSAHVAAGQGLLVTMTCRAVGIAVSIVGVGFYLTSGRQVTEVLPETGTLSGRDIASS